MGTTTKKSLYRRPRLTVLPAVAVSIVMAALLVLATATDQAAAQARSGGTFHGLTSQGFSGYVKTSGSGVLIDKASIPIEVQCSLGPMLLPQQFRFVPVQPSGRFKETGTASVEEEGVTLDLFESFSGKFNRQRTSVVTKSRIYLTIHGPDGSVEKCDSGIVTMHARN